MSLALAQALGMTPRPSKARGRLVLNLTGDLTALKGRKKTSVEVRRERELIYAAIEQLGSPTRDEIAQQTGIHPDTVTARLNWLSTHGIAHCRRTGQTATWKIKE